MIIRIKLQSMDGKQRLCAPCLLHHIDTFITPIYHQQQAGCSARWPLPLPCGPHHAGLMLAEFMGACDQLGEASGDCQMVGHLEIPHTAQWGV